MKNTKTCIILSGSSHKELLGLGPNVRYSVLFILFHYIVFQTFLFFVGNLVYLFTIKPVIKEDIQRELVWHLSASF